MYHALEGSVDAIGQWLTQLSVFGQTLALLAFLLPVGGAAASRSSASSTSSWAGCPGGGPNGRPAQTGRESNWLSTIAADAPGRGRGDLTMRKSPVKIALFVLIILVLVAGLLTQI